MKISLKFIEEMSEVDRYLYSKFINRFLRKASPTELRQAQIILSRPSKKQHRFIEDKQKRRIFNNEPHFKKEDSYDFRVIKSTIHRKIPKVIQIIRKEYDGQNIDSESKICRKCNELKFLSDFSNHTNICKECKGIESRNFDVIILYGEGKECTQCLDFKKWDEFPFSLHSKAKKSPICRDCNNLNRRLLRLTNINFRLASSLRGRIWSVLKGNKKSASTEILLGCSVDFLRKHLESQFTYGMSWDNYGTGKNGKGMKEWHVDHIIPCCNFDLSKSEEQRKCFHYSNLQPLWAKKNLEKNKFI